MNRARISVLAAIVSVGILLLSTNARAITYFLYSNNRPVNITESGTTHTYTITGSNSGPNRLSWKSATSDWVRESSPSGVGSFYTASGLAAAVPDVNWSGGSSRPRIYLVAAPNGTNSATLYEFSHDGTGAALWRSLGAPSSGLSGSPALDATYDPTSHEVFVAARTADGHTWSCLLVTATSSCVWEDETCRSTTTCGTASTASPIKINASRAMTNGGDVEFFTVSSSGDLQRYRYFFDDWDFPGKPLWAPGTPTDQIVDTVALQARTYSGGTRVLMAGWDQRSAGDTAWLYAYDGYGTSGTGWTYLFDSNKTPPSGGIAPAAGGLAWASDGTTDRIWAADESGLRLWYINPYALNPVWTSTKPPDQKSDRDVVGGAIYATGSTAILPGGMGPALSGVEYLYAFDAASVRWSNHLAPHDPTTTLPAGIWTGNDPSEYAADESAGTVVVGASAATLIGGNTVDQTYVWRSTNDGSSWPTPTTPWSNGTRGDEAITFDPNGIPYVVVISASSNTLSITRWNSSTLQWTTPLNLTNIALTPFPDRPWVEADRVNHPGALYVASQAGLSFCNGTSNCADSLSPWCATISLPSTCTGNYQASCQIAQAGNGDIWISLPGDSGCPVPPSNYPQLNGSADDEYVKTVGFRRIIVNSYASCAGTPVTYSSVPECVYFISGALTGPDLKHPNTGNQLNRGTSSPGYTEGRHWAMTISASRDSSAVLGLTAWVYEQPDGAFCSGASTACQSEQMFAYRRTDGTWCGSSSYGCATSIDPGFPPTQRVMDQTRMRPLNTDYAPTPRPQLDHILGSIAALDYKQFATTWLDFRADTAASSLLVGDDAAYAFRTAFLDGTSGSATLWESPEWRISSSSVAVGSYSNWFGDVNTPVNARLHTHLINEYFQNTTGSALAQTSSPACRTGAAP